MGRPEAAEDPDFAEGQSRALNEARVDQMTEAWTRTLSKYEVARICKEKRVPAAPVRTLPEVAADQPLKTRRAMFDVDHPQLGKVTLPGSPLRFHGSPEPQWVANPLLGEHTGEVLGEWLGVSDDIVEGLATAGVVGVSR